MSCQSAPVVAQLSLSIGWISVLSIMEVQLHPGSFACKY
ncbi:unnamed protein product, partial [Staurois parvus]